MKKMFSILLVLGLLLAVSSLAMATAGSTHGAGLSSQATLNATVQPYASLVFGSYVAAPHLSGIANEPQFGSLAFAAAANCAVDIELDATDMTLLNPDNQESRVLPTLYAVDYTGTTGVYQAPGFIIGSCLDESADSFTIRYKVADGAIQDQHAGNYSANITLTILAQAY